MNNVLVVPDIHGRDFWRPALKYKGEIVFLGDYVDPNPDECFTDKQALEGLRDRPI